MTTFIHLNEVLVDIDRYDLQEIIGKGGFGTVFRAIDKVAGKDVAVKIINEKLNDKKQQANLLREVTVPLYLELPGIVNLLGFRFPLTPDEKKDLSPDKQTITKKDTKGKTQIVSLTGALVITELMKNGSLDVLVKEYIESKGEKHDKINPTIRSKIIFGVAATMKKVHQSNVIHRDLKLENVFLDDNLEPRIADFGLAKIVLNSVEMTMAIGTPYIMAPEIFMDGDETYTVSVDVYAYAFLLYKMFCNDLPMNDKRPIRSPQQYMMRVSKGMRPVKQDCIPDVYWELIVRCWDQNPSDRPTFEEITRLLRDDKFAINEFEMKTDLDQLHEYQNRIDDDSGPTIDFSKSMSHIVSVGDKKLLVKGQSKSELHKSTGDLKTTSPLKAGRKTVFNWKRH